MRASASVPPRSFGHGTGGTMPSPLPQIDSGHRRARTAAAVSRPVGTRGMRRVASARSTARSGSSTGRRRDRSAVGAGGGSTTVRSGLGHSRSRGGTQGFGSRSRRGPLSSARSSVSSGADTRRFTDRRDTATGGPAPQRFTFDLRRAIQAAEKRMDDEIAAATEHSQRVVNMAAQRVAAEDALYAEKQAMRERTEAGASQYLSGIVEKSEVLAELRAERDVLKLDVEEHLPYWMVRWAAFTKWLVSVAHTHGWRVEAKGVINEMMDFFTRDAKESLMPDLREMIVNINSWAPSKFKRHMDAIRDAAHKMELERPSAYTAAYERLAECDARIKATNDAMTASVRGTAAATEFDKGASLTRKLQHSEALLATIKPAAEPQDDLPPPSIAAHIRRFVSASGRRLAPTVMRKEFHEMLTFCASSGAWQDAFKAYGAMLECRVPPTDFTYKTMITACKHSQPVNSAAAVAVLAEMRRRGHSISASLFNRAIDACRMQGSWRRGLTVFQAMVEAGCAPTTATYQALGEACAKAPIEDAPDVYAAMKYSGVPELLSYTASMKAIHGDRGAGAKPRRRLGSPVRSVPSASQRRGGVNGSGSSAGGTRRRSGSRGLRSTSASGDVDVDDMRATTAPFGAVGLGGSQRSVGERGRARASTLRGTRAVSPLTMTGGSSLLGRSFEWRSGTLLGLGELNTD